MTTNQKEAPLVLVTGGGSGIGRALCRNLHQRGYSLLVVSLLQAELDSLKEELVNGPPVETLALDITTEGAAAKILAFAKSLERFVEILINNAGVGLFGNHIDLPEERVALMLKLNVLALTEITSLFGREMAERGHGKILNVASTASFQPLPRMAAYAASKSYVASFSAALAEELGPRGVQVSVFYPGTTRTPFLESAGVNDAKGLVGTIAKWAAMEPDTAAEIALRGFFANEQEIVPGPLNMGHFLTTRLLPKRLATKVFDVIGQRRG